MRALFLAYLAVVFSGTASAEVFNGSSSFSLGPNGLSVQNPGMNQPAQINYNGRGVFSTSFSLFGNGGSAAATPPTRVLSSVPSTSSALTDSDTFFQSVGK